MTSMTWLLIVALWFAGPAAAQPPDPATLTGRVVRPISGSSDVLAVASSPDGHLLGVVMAEPLAGTDKQRLILLAYHAQPSPQLSSALTLDLGGHRHNLTDVGLAIDGAGRAFVATRGGGPTMQLASVDLRRPGQAAPRIATVKFGQVDRGDSTMVVSRLRIGRNGELVIAGMLDGQGLVAALGADGTHRWMRRLDGDVALVTDLVEIDDGWIWVGLVPGSFSMGHLRVGRLDRQGIVSDAPRQPTADVESRSPRLARRGDQLGLVYDSVDTLDRHAEVYLELLHPLASVDSRRRLLYAGDLWGRWTIATTGDGFVLAGASHRLELRVDQVDADLTLRPMFRSIGVAPTFRAFDFAEVLASSGHLWLVTVESVTIERAQRRELIVARVNLR